MRGMRVMRGNRSAGVEDGKEKRRKGRKRRWKVRMLLKKDGLLGLRLTRSMGSVKSASSMRSTSSMKSEGGGLKEEEEEEEEQRQEEDGKLERWQREKPVRRSCQHLHS